MEAIGDRIRLVEQRLAAREQAIALRIGAIGERLRVATRPQRWLPAAAGISVALAALWWLLRGRLPAQGRAAATAHHASERAASDMAWTPLLALAWPLLPARWRTRVSPATAAAVMSVGIPLAQRLLAGSPHPPLPTMDALDLVRYAGTWHELARLPTRYEARCDDQPCAHYAAYGDGLLVLNECHSGGVRRLVRGVARVLPNSGNAKLKVSFWPAWLQWLPLAWADYWVLHVDEAYQVALVGDPARRHLWLLSRGRRIDAARFDHLVRLAAERGFAVDRLIDSRPA